MNVNLSVFEHNVQLKVGGRQFNTVTMPITESYVLTNASVHAANEWPRHAATVLDVITLVRGTPPRAQRQCSN